MNRKLVSPFVIVVLLVILIGVCNEVGPLFGQVPGSRQGQGSQSSGGAVDTPMGMYASKPGKWSIQVDERSNSLIVTAPLSKLDEIARLVEVMDNRTVNARMEERIFKLRYIDRKTLESAIRMILPRFDVKTQMIDVTTDDRRREAATVGSGGSTSSTVSAPPPGR